MGQYLFSAMVAILLLANEAYGAEAARPESNTSTVSAAVDDVINALKQGPASNLTGGQMALYVLDVERGLVTLMLDRPTKDLNYCGSPAWSRDGKRIYLDASPGQSFGQTRLKLIDVAQGKLRLSDLGPGNCPSPSPDGQRTVFVLNPGMVNKVESGMWLMQADGSTCDRLDGVVEFGIPRWSPDSPHILLKRFGNPVVLSVIDVTNERKPVTRTVNLPGHELLSLPNWADDGKTVISVVKATNLVEIVFIDVTQPAQAKVKQVLWRKTDGPAISPTQPAYSARTQYCVFAAKDRDDWVLYSMKLGQGRPPQRIEPTDYGESISSLCFSPDGRYLLFCGKRIAKR